MSEEKAGYDAGETIAQIENETEEAGIDVEVRGDAVMIEVWHTHRKGVYFEMNAEQTAQLINALQSAQDAVQGRSES